MAYRNDRDAQRYRAEGLEDSLDAERLRAKALEDEVARLRGANEALTTRARAAAQVGSSPQRQAESPSPAPRRPGEATPDLVDLRRLAERNLPGADHHLAYEDRTHKAEVRGALLWWVAAAASVLPITVTVLVAGGMGVGVGIGALQGAWLVYASLFYGIYRLDRLQKARVRCPQCEQPVGVIALACVNCGARLQYGASSGVDAAPPPAESVWRAPHAGPSYQNTAPPLRDADPRPDGRLYEQPLARAKKLAETLVPLCEGTVTERDGEAVVVTGEYQGQWVQVEFGIAAGGLHFRAKRTEVGAFLLLQFDGRGQAGYERDQKRRGDRGGEQGKRLFISQNVYYQDEVGPLSKHWRVWYLMPSRLRKRIIATLEDESGSLRCRGKDVELIPVQSMLEREDAARAVYECFELVADVAAHKL